MLATRHSFILSEVEGPLATRHFLVVVVPANELELVIKEEEAGGFAGLHGEGRESAVFVVEFVHAAKVDVADDVHVVKEKGF